MNFLRRLQLNAYGFKANKTRKEKGKSPLQVPNKTIGLSFVYSLLIALLIGSLFFPFLKKLSKKQLKEATYFTPVSDNIDASVVKFLTPNYIKKFEDGKNDKYKSLSDNINNSFKNGITLESTTNFLNEIIKNNENKIDEDDEDKLIDLIIGDLKYNLILYAKTEKEIVIEEFNIESSYTIDEDLSLEKLTQDFTIALLQNIRNELGGSFNEPRRLLSGLADYIQWLIFVLAIWGMVLIIVIRSYWVKLQEKLVDEGHLPWQNKLDNNLWSETALLSNEDKIPLYQEINKKFPNTFVTTQLIHEVIAYNKLKDKRPLKEFISERISAYRESVDRGEYDLLYWVKDIIPSLGFLGTIIGIIGAMENASAIFQANTQIEQSMALDVVSSYLGTAFDTSAVGLIWLIPFSFFLSKLHKSEAAFFENLEAKTKKYLPPMLEISKEK